MSQQGIQTLLEAEKEAAKIVTKARQYRIQRLKDAKAEAQKEIETLKAEKQNHFLSTEKYYNSSIDSTYAGFNVDTEKKLEELKTAYNTHKNAVVQRLLNCVVDCKPMIHVNARK